MTHTAQVGDLRIAYIDEGPPDGVPVLMLHGFPDGPFTFDHLAGRCTAAGYRVIRPALRGYPPTEVPEGRRIGLDALVGDVEGLADHLQLDRPVLLGHDWGAVIGWAATSRPTGGSAGRWRGLIAMAVPPPPVQARAARNPVQVLRRSGYMLWMLLPGIERAMPRIAERLYRRWSPGWTPPADHMARVRRITTDSRAARAAAGYYRAIVPAVLTGRHPADRSAVPDIPVRYLHGEQDTCFTARTALRARRHLPAGSVRIVARSGHFLHLERPEEIADDVLRSLDRLR